MKNPGLVDTRGLTADGRLRHRAPSRIEEEFEEGDHALERFLLLGMH